MISKIVVIEPSFVLRKGIVALLQENFEHIVTIEESSKGALSIISHRDEDVLYLIAMRLYRKNKEFLEKLNARIVFLSYKNMDVPYINYLKTTEEEFIVTIERALGINTEVAKDNEEEILTESERNVLSNIALGLSNKEIANKLFISIHTVTTHRKNITRKLDIKSVSGLTVYAILHKLVSMNDIQS